MIMRKEVRNWFAQALKDLETAERNIDIGEYYASAFFAHQAVEKALKALYIRKESPLPHHIHYCF